MFELGLAPRCSNEDTDLSKHFRSLVEIHAAPRWLWRALVAAMVKGEARRRGDKLYGIRRVSA
jgi:hypothetical protein